MHKPLHDPIVWSKIYDTAVLVVTMVMVAVDVVVSLYLNDAIHNKKVGP